MGDGVAEDLATRLQGPLGNVQRVPRLDLLRHGQQHGRGDVGNGPVANLGEHVGLEPAQHVVGMPLGLWALPVFEPCSGHGLEVVFHAHEGRGLGVLLALHRILSALESDAGIVPRAPGLGQPDGRVSAEREPLFLAHPPVLPAPVFAPRGHDFEVQAAGIREARAGLVRRAFGVLAGGVGQGHFGGLSEAGGGKSPALPPTMPPLWLSCQNAI